MPMPMSDPTAPTSTKFTESSQVLAPLFMLAAPLMKSADTGVPAPAGAATNTATSGAATSETSARIRGSRRAVAEVAGLGVLASVITFTSFMVSTVTLWKHLEGQRVETGEIHAPGTRGASG